MATLSPNKRIFLKTSSLEHHYLMSNTIKRQFMWVNLPFVEGLIVALHEVVLCFWSSPFLLGLPAGEPRPEEWLLLRHWCLQECSLPCLPAEAPKGSWCVTKSLACAIIASSSSWTFPVWGDGSCSVPFGLSTCWPFPAASVHESMK